MWEGRPCGSAALGAMRLSIKRCIAARARLLHPYPSAARFQAQVLQSASMIAPARQALEFLLAARACEREDLRALTHTVHLVEAVAGFVHCLQGERGLSSLLLARADASVQDRRDAQIHSSDAALAALHQRVQAIDTNLAHGGHGARLFSRLALALQAVQALPALREQVQAGRFDVQQSTAAYSRLVQAWLSVVFEAADVAGDADVSRLLVALFNLSHSKEQVGQERALGSALFASGRIDEEARHQVQDLIDSQQRGLASFAHFAPSSLQAGQGAGQVAETGDARARLRRLLLAPSEHGALNAELGRPWFDACTEHMEALRHWELDLLAQLRRLCAEKLAQLERAQVELQAVFARGAPAPSPERALLSLAASGAGPELETQWQARLGQAASGALGPELARHVMELVQQQAERLQQVTAELDEARASLQHRKLIERAKGLLMAQAGHTEEEAYQALRRHAMQQGRRVVEVAEDLLQRTH